MLHCSLFIAFSVDPGNDSSNQKSMYGTIRAGLKRSPTAAVNVFGNVFNYWEWAIRNYTLMETGQIQVIEPPYGNRHLNCVELN